MKPNKEQNTKKMAKPVKKVRVVSVKNPNNVKYIVERLANNTLYMRENGFVIDEEPETMEPLAHSPGTQEETPTEETPEPVKTSKGDESNVNEYADKSSKELVKLIKEITNVKVLEKIEAMELNRGDDARKTVLGALEKRFKSIA